MFSPDRSMIMGDMLFEGIKLITNLLLDLLAPSLNHLIKKLRIRIRMKLSGRNRGVHLKSQTKEFIVEGF